MVDRQALRYAENPQVDDADRANQHGHADEVQGFAQRPDPVISCNETVDSGTCQQIR
jgi:hypothetical protein